MLVENGLIRVMGVHREEIFKPGNLALTKLLE